jgi:hypothetical protein
VNVDTVFVEGVAAVVAAIIVFCGSVWLVLTLVVGPRLAYFVTASITLGFLVIMGVVWSLPALNPLGPVGKLPEWDPIAIGESADALDFGPAQSYPDNPWHAPNEDDVGETTRAGELQNDGLDYLDNSLEEGTIKSFEDSEDAGADAESVRLLTQDGDEYGGVTFEPLEGKEGRDTVVIMKYDSGNPLGPARMITAGTAILWIAHLFGLGAAERKAREEREAAGEA